MKMRFTLLALGAGVAISLLIVGINLNILQDKEVPDTLVCQCDCTKNQRHSEILAVSRKDNPTLPLGLSTTCKPCKEVESTMPFLSLAYDNNCIPCKKQNGIHLITNFFPVTHPQWRKSINIDHIADESLRNQVVEHRLEELHEVLQRNLNNELISAVHLLYEHPYIMLHLSKLNLKNKNKLVLHRVDKDPTYRHAIDYATEYLMNRIVVFTNQDIYLGEGWDKISISKMRQNRILYALTRHGKQERYCKMFSSCTKKLGYIGSHDTFSFVPVEKFPEEGLNEINRKSDDLGLENILIWVFQTKFKYKALNPCFILKTYHNHCDGSAHNKGRPRINNDNNTGGAGFTDKLE